MITIKVAGWAPYGSVNESSLITPEIISGIRELLLNQSGICSPKDYCENVYERKARRVTITCRIAISRNRQSAPDNPNTKGVAYDV